MSEQPLFVVDLRETGLEFRVKEPKVTALCFRPAVHEGPDEGRYLWCGTKDGHLWELDLKTGEITDTKAFAHASGITHLFRYKTHMLSMDEGGKAHVFDVCSPDADARRIPNPVRTLRTSDKQTFVKVIAGQLWTASSPAHRSTTNSASRGPTIRVYDPFSAAGAANPTGKTLFTNEWTGAVTSASLLPFDPSLIDLGHEGGFVSIWNAETFACTLVLKISNSDVLSLEGVGDRLWVGGRKGTINVYNVKTRPWTATNSWTAHQ
jgi:WD40 repeat protein